MILMREIGRALRVAALTSGAVLVFLSSQILIARAEVKYTTVYSFQGVPDGAVAWGTLTADAEGNFYGVTDQGGSGNCTDSGGTPIGCGTVYELSPVPVTGGYTETVLYSFTGGTDGSNPLSGLLLGSGGVLYGTTTRGGDLAASGCGGAGCGTVFSLTPPAAGRSKWTEKVLLSFENTDGVGPQGTLIADANGALYGTTTYGGSHGDGVVFQLAPKGNGKYARKVLFSFNGEDGEYPYAGLVAGSGSVLYGTAIYGGDPHCQTNSGTDPTIIGCGTVFALSPPAAGKTAWTHSEIYRFRGNRDGKEPGPLVISQTGTLYGVTEFGGGSTDCAQGDPPSPDGCGTAFELTPPAVVGGAWTETVLRRFSGEAPDGGNPVGLVIDGNDIYGTSSGTYSGAASTFFRLEPPATAADNWHFSTLYTFDGSILPNGPFLSTDGKIWGSTAYDGGQGTVFNIVP
jgi:uncharacterized repeat protein (TIGR03803 family)